MNLPYPLLNPFFNPPSYSSPDLKTYIPFPLITLSHQSPTYKSSESKRYAPLPTLFSSWISPKYTDPFVYSFCFQSTLTRILSNAVNILFSYKVSVKYSDKPKYSDSLILVTVIVGKLVRTVRRVKGWEEEQWEGVGLSMMLWLRVDSFIVERFLSLIFLLLSLCFWMKND